MWRERALFKQHGRSLAAALLAVQANFERGGFRQRDVRFYFELFLAWSDGFLFGQGVRAENVQFARVLKSFVKDGLAKQVGKSTPVHYRLTRSGLLESVRMLVDDLSPARITESLFVLYFLRSYGARISRLIETTFEHHSVATQRELEELLSAERLRKHLLKSIEKQIDHLAEYAKRCDSAAKETKKRFEDGKSLREVAEFLQKSNPYQLNNQKPLRELYPELAEDHAKWELTEGLSKRSAELWQPLLRVLQGYREVLSIKL